MQSQDSNISYLSAYQILSLGLFEPGSHIYTCDVLLEGGLHSFQNAHQVVAVVRSLVVVLPPLPCFSKNMSLVAGLVVEGLALE